MALPNRAFLRASLALWRRREKYRRERHDHWQRLVDHARTQGIHPRQPVIDQRDKWSRLLRTARAKIALREKQLGITHPTQPHGTGSGKGSFGVDWAWGTPDMAALLKAGVRFAGRYLSHDPTKNLTRGEAAALAAHGIDCVVVWESTSNRALGGRTAGINDAQAALEQARACGLPSGAPIYFAIDFDATASQQPRINAYFQGVHSVLDSTGAADFPQPVPVGAYGGYGPLQRLFDARLIEYGWQTYAWSGEKWLKQAQLQQYSNGHELAGVSCDYDRAISDDFGQWRPTNY